MERLEGSVLILGEAHNCKVCAREEVKILSSLKNLEGVIWEPLDKDVRSLKEAYYDLVEERKKKGGHKTNNGSFYKTHLTFMKEVLKRFGKIYGVENQPADGFLHYYRIVEKIKKLYKRKDAFVVVVVGVTDVPVLEILLSLEGIPFSSKSLHPYKGKHELKEKVNDLKGYKPPLSIKDEVINSYLREYSAKLSFSHLS